MIEVICGPNRNVHDADLVHGIHAAFMQHSRSQR